MSSPYTLRWGIIATGSISSQFTHDLVLPPDDRMIQEHAGQPVDVRHIVTAVGSRSLASAQKFIDSVLPNDPELRSACKPHDSYASVFAADDVDIVYIGTPHTYHYENTRDALNAGKHVLCEKPFTFDLAELDELIALAREKKRFLMEAVWTRFHPIAYEVQRVIASGEYGPVWRVLADLSLDAGCDAREAHGDRMIDPELGGGSLLDLGPYPMVWVSVLKSSGWRGFGTARQRKDEQGEGRQGRGVPGWKTSVPDGDAIVDGGRWSQKAKGRCRDDDDGKGSVRAGRKRQSMRRGQRWRRCFRG